MDYLTDGHKMLRENVRNFVEAEIAPKAKKIDEEGIFPEENIRMMAELGFLGAHIPEEYGGAGLDFTSFVIIMEEVARGCASTAITLAAHASLCAYPILKFGNEEQKKRILPELCAGTKLGAFALTESGAGSDAGATKTIATREDDFYIVNGSKMFCTNGSRAGYVLFTAKTDPSAPRSRGISSLIAEKGMAGFVVGKNEDKMGLRGSVTTQLFFENCKIPASNLLGKEGKGFFHFMKTLDEGRISFSALALGIAVSSLEESIKYSKERYAFGMPIGKMETIQGYIAEMATQIEAARHLIYLAARKLDAGESVTREAAMAKLFSGEMVNFVTNKGVQIHGGYGFIRDFKVEQNYRDSRLCEIGEGTSEIQKLVIAREILGEF